MCRQRHNSTSDELLKDIGASNLQSTKHKDFGKSVEMHLTATFSTGRAPLPLIS